MRPTSPSRRPLHGLETPAAVRPRTAGPAQCSSPTTPGKSPVFRAAHFTRKRSPADAITEGGGGPVTKNQLEAALAEKDAEIVELHEQVAYERRRLAMVESELKLTAAAAQQAEGAHLEEMGKVEGDLKRVLAERRSLMHQIQTVGVVDDAVRELYLQMKERFADDAPPTPEQLQAEKAALQSESVLVVLGHLHALVKTLWVFKVEAEEDMRGTRLSRQHQAADSAGTLRARIRALEAELRAAHQDAAAAKLRADLEAEAKEAVLLESLDAVQSVTTQYNEVLEEMRAATAEAHTLKASLKVAHEEGRRRDALVMANRQLESARHFDRAATDKQLKSMQSEHARQIASVNRGAQQTSAIAAENSKLKQQLQQVLDQSAAYKRAERLSSRQELLREVQTMRSELSTTRLALGKLTGWALEVAESGLPLQAGLPPPPLPATEAVGLSLQGASKLNSANGAVLQAGAAGDTLSGACEASAEPQTLAKQAEALMEELRLKARRAARDEATKEVDPVLKVIANVNPAHKQAIRALKDVRRELADGPAAARAAQRAGAPLVSDSALAGLDVVSPHQRGLAGHAADGPDGGLSSLAGTGGSIARAWLPTSVTGLPDWRSRSTSSTAAESLLLIKATMDAGLGPLTEGLRMAKDSMPGDGGMLSSADGSSAFRTRVANVGRVQSARP